MDRRERAHNPAETLKLAMEWKQAQMWTALPGIVARYPGTAGYALTIDVQPTIQGLVTDSKGHNSWKQMPVIQDCPLLFQGGGGVTATFPIKASTVTNGVSNNDGDECLLIFSARAIDLWFVNGGIQEQVEPRMHNLSDGFALVGVRSVPRSFALDRSAACLITDDGQTYFKLNPTTKAIASQAPGGITLNGVTIDQNGNIVTPTTIVANGNITSHATISADTDVLAAGKSGKSHIHADPQGGDVGPPL